MMFDLLIRKIEKSCQEIQHRGFKTYLKHLSNDLWSRKRILVYLLHKNAYKPNIYTCPDGVEFIQIDDNSELFWIDALASSWPRELEQYRSKEYLRCVLHTRLKEGDICLLAHRRNDVVGAVWIGKTDKVLLELENPLSHEPGVIKSFFVTPEMRGKGLGKYLLFEAINVARNRGRPTLFSLIYHNRKSSKFVHETAGFIPIGELLIKRAFFRVKTVFCPFVGQEYMRVDNGN